MRSLIRRLTALIILTALMLSACAQAAQTPEIRRGVLPGLREDSYAAWPVLFWPDGRTDERLESVNRAVYHGSGMDRYLMALMQPGGSSGFQADYEAGLWGEGLYSVRLTARGRMPGGRPGQRCHSFLFSWEEGRMLTAEELFSDPEKALRALEGYVEESILPGVSDYLSQADLLPLPLDSWTVFHDAAVFDYDPERYTLLSGAPGAVSFTLEELSAITGEHETLSRFQTMPFAPDEKTGPLIREDIAQGLFPGLWLSLAQPARLGLALETVLATGAKAADSMAYLDGAAIETENPFLRGILLLTDPDEKAVTGYLARRGNLYGLVIGKALRQDVYQALGAPATSLTLDESAAALWRVDPGTEDVYTGTDETGKGYILSFGFDISEKLTSVTFRLAGEED